MLKEILQTNSESAWLIGENYKQNLKDLFSKFIASGESIEKFSKAPELTAAYDTFAANAAASLNISAQDINLVGPYQVKYGEVKPNSIAVIHMEGVLLKHGSWYGFGTQDLSNQLLKAASNPNIIGAIIVTDSPGGNVSGVRLFSDTINAVKKRMPVIAYINDGVCASGAYWIASQCDEIISSHETNTIGSIGVVITIYDFDKYYEAMGITKKDIYAKGSEGKHSEFRAAFEGNEEAIKTKLLNPIRESFVTHVKDGRQGKLKTKDVDPFSGEIFGDITSKNIGLVDAIGDLQTAIDSIVRRANSFSKSTSTYKSGTQTKSKITMKRKLIVGTHDALISALGIEVKDGDKEFEVDAIDALTAQQGIDAKAAEDHRQATTKSLEAITASMQKVTDSVAKIATDSTSNATSIKTLQGSVAALGEATGIKVKPKAEGADTPPGDDGNQGRPQGRLFPHR